jgi:choline dehydrogenase-like flavoprotein
MENTDIIVVGGGSAGAAMAARLAEGGLTVTLLEAGCSDRMLKSRVPALTSSIVQNPQFDWRYTVEPDPRWAGGRMSGRQASCWAAAVRSTA